MVFGRGRGVSRNAATKSEQAVEWSASQSFEEDLMVMDSNKVRGNKKVVYVPSPNGRGVSRNAASTKSQQAVEWSASQSFDEDLVMDSKIRGGNKKMVYVASPNVVKATPANNTKRVVAANRRPPRATSPRAVPPRATSPRAVPPRATSPRAVPQVKEHSSHRRRAGAISPTHSRASQRRGESKSTARATSPAHSARSGSRHRRSTGSTTGSTHSRTIGRARASEKFEIVDGEDEKRLIERFKKFEKFEAKLVGGKDYREEREYPAPDARRRRRGKPVLLEIGDDETREAFDESYIEEEKKRRNQKGKKTDRRKSQHRKSVVAPSESNDSGYLDYDDDADGELMQCGDEMVKEGFNCMSDYGGCHIVIVPSYDDGEGDDDKESWNVRERSRRDKTPSKKRRSKSSRSSRKSDDHHWTDYFMG